jgi:hypothetical protein
MGTSVTLHLNALDRYSPDMALWLEHFQAGRYRTSLDYIEAVWFPDRTAFHRGLIQLTVGMNQLATTHLVTGPHYLFISSRKLLKPFEPAHLGVDVAAARKLAASALRELRKRAIAPTLQS